MANQEIVNLSVDLLQPNPVQPRGDITPASISDLVESIREHGILEPLVVAKTPAGYQIVSGERRWRAARSLGLNTVPVIVKEMSPEEMIKVTLVDNVQREGLNPLDRAKSFRKLKDEFGLSWVEIGKDIGKSVPYVVNTVKLLTLPDALKDGLLSGLISEGHARALSAIEDTRLMIEAYKIVLKEQASVRRAEEIARRIKENAKKIDSEGNDALVRIEFAKSELDEIGRKIANAFGPLEVKVDITQSKVRANIHLVADGSVKKTNEFIYSFFRKITGSPKS